MSEDAWRAAQRTQIAADSMLQACRNVEGTLERFHMLWERQIYPDLCGFMDRLEALHPPAATVAKLKTFSDGKLRPFLEPEAYDQLRDDDRFLYNRKPTE